MYALLLTLAPVLAAPPEPRPAGFVVSGAHDEPITSKLLRFAPDLTATLASRTGETSVKDVIALRRANRPLPPFPTGRQLITANGERIAGEFLGGGGQAFRFVPHLASLKDEEAWRVPTALTAAVWFTDMPADTPLEPARYSWGDGVRNRDVFRFRNGDTARGILVGLGPDGPRPALQFRPETGDARAVTSKELAAILFNPLLTKPRKPKGAHCRVVLTDGSRFDVTNVSIAGKGLKGDTNFGQAVEVPLETVVALTVLQGKAVYLSDVKPKKVEQSGFLGVVWPPASDRSVTGAPLKLSGTLGDSTFDKGLGTAPRTVLTYDLAGKYQRFEALVGLDPDASGLGQVAVRVLVDGKEQPVPRLGTLRAGEPVPVRVSVAAGKELVLEVNYGPTGSVAANVNWAEARFVE